MTREFDVRIGRWVRDSRAELGLSQAALAVQADLPSQTTVWSIETGRRPVSLEEAVALTRVLVKPLPAFAVPESWHCWVCGNNPPRGFTCNACGMGGAS